jgi:hypothetical protein
MIKVITNAILEAKTLTSSTTDSKIFVTIDDNIVVTIELISSIKKFKFINNAKVILIMDGVRRQMAFSWDEFKPDFRNIIDMIKKFRISS